MRARKSTAKSSSSKTTTTPPAPAKESESASPSAANQVIQIWLKGRDQALMLNIEKDYADQLMEAIGADRPTRDEAAFLVLRHGQGTATAVRCSDLQAVRAMNALEFQPNLLAPLGTEVWIALHGSAMPLTVRMAEDDAWQLCDLFYTLELGPSEDDRYQLHGQTGDLLAFKPDELVWIQAADDFLRLGRKQVAIEDGLPLED